jgi:flavin-dependent dehydrogenase
MAARLYVQLDSGRNDHDAAGHGGALQVFWSKDFSPGYGWIFPGPGDVYNLGVGTFQTQPKADAKGRNLREMFSGFVAGNTVARRLLREGRVLGRIKGAPLRSTLTGARWWRPGMLVCGEAAGSTYDFTGEGIGKALETGILAAEAITASLTRQGEGEDPGPAYAAALEGLRTRFELYQRGNLINRKPWIAEVLVGLARASPRLRARMGLLLEEEITPDALLSAAGLLRMMWTRSLPG